ncbi:hypothetical protein FGO68_gene16217 [Halteria grandinella]|uniref:Uncharacterized protein n=1 Tax=Halteria grandinella TaxID=5974 RepID=A0A8J8T069_HALGN|nr:hypothetical protein FGO68_gene16217 [Halteria grandinella]
MDCKTDPLASIQVQVIIRFTNESIDEETKRLVQQIDNLTVQHETVIRQNQEKVLSSSKQLELKRDALQKVERQHRDLRAKANAIRLQLGLSEDELVNAKKQDQKPQKSLEEMREEVARAMQVRDKLAKENKDLNEALANGGKDEIMVRNQIQQMRAEVEALRSQEQNRFTIEW